MSKWSLIYRRHTLCLMVSLPYQPRGGGVCGGVCIKQMIKRTKFSKKHYWSSGERGQALLEVQPRDLMAQNPETTFPRSQGRLLSIGVSTNHKEQLTDFLPHSWLSYPFTSNFKKRLFILQATLWICWQTVDRDQHQDS